MERTTPDARALVDQLRLRAQARSQPWHPDPLPGPPHRVPMTAHPGLKHLHEHWALPDRFDGAGGRGGPRWKQLVWRAAGRVTGGVLHDYVTAERELIANMVQYCDAMAKRVDALERDIDTLAQAGSRQAAELATHLVPPPPAPTPGMPDMPDGTVTTPGAGSTRDRSAAAGTAVGAASGTVTAPASGTAGGTAGEIAEDASALNRPATSSGKPRATGAR